MQLRLLFFSLCAYASLGFGCGLGCGFFCQMVGSCAACVDSCRRLLAVVACSELLACYGCMRIVAATSVVCTKSLQFLIATFHALAIFLRILCRTHGQQRLQLWTIYKFVRGLQADCGPSAGYQSATARCYYIHRSTLEESG